MMSSADGWPPAHAAAVRADRRVVVTGVAGFIGVPLAAALLRRGFEVVGIDNFAVGNRSAIGQLADRHRRLEVVEVDVRDAVELARTIRRARPWGVVHLAALHFIPYCTAHPEETLAVNVLGLQHLLDAIDGSDVQRLVFTSTADVYSPSRAPHTEGDPLQPTNVYGASKLMGEWLIRFWREQGGTTSPVIARLFNVYGPGETNPHVLKDICELIRIGDILPLGEVTNRRDFTFVGDVVEVLVSLLSSDLTDLVVNVGTGRSWSVEEVVERLAVLTGRELRIEIDQAKRRRSDRPNLQADTRQLGRILGDATPTPLDAGLRRLLGEEGILRRPPDQERDNGVHVP